ncbi:MAG: hypothetical protein COA78_20365 [Blastopirellula sp.]|nr:MAG: hypothetical protein COA78_20365 [Blastopirellula sp.]
MNFNKQGYTATSIRKVVRGTVGNEFGVENIGEAVSKVNNGNTLVIHTLNESGTVDVVERNKDDVYNPFANGT